MQMVSNACGHLGLGPRLDQVGCLAQAVCFDPHIQRCHRGLTLSSFCVCISGGVPAYTKRSLATPPSGLEVRRKTLAEEHALEVFNS